MNNIYIIGDVHGCFHTLKKLIAQLPLNAEIIFVGDLVDKGNFSKDVVDFVIEKNYKCILGNHEYLMLKNIENALYKDISSDWSSLKNFGGYKTINSYKDDKKTLEKHLEWIGTLPQYIEVDKYFITHAFGLPYYKRKDDKEAYQALMSNRPSDEKEWGYDWEKDYLNYDIINVFGHQVHKRVELDKNYIGIDTGCVYGNSLTALRLHSLEIFQEKLDAIDT